MYKLTTKIFVIILIFLIAIVSGAFFINSNVELKKVEHLNMETKILQTKYDASYKFFKIISRDVYQMYSTNKKVIDIFKEACKTTDEKALSKIRQDLYLQLKKKYKRLKNMGVIQLHFHLPDNTSFLRMHKPSKFGDNLTEIRYSVARANKLKEFTEGFEFGKVIHGFRFVYPLFDEENIHIGSMEVSLSSEQLMKNIEDVNAKNTHFLVSKKLIQEKTWDVDKLIHYEDSVISKDFLIEKPSFRTNEKIKNFYKNLSKETKQEIAKHLKTRKSFNILTKKDKEDKQNIVIIYISIKNVIGSKGIAYLTILYNDTHIDKIELENKYYNILFFSIIFLLFFFVVYAATTNDKLKNMAYFDTLTHLPNRALFYIEFEKELNRAKRFHKKLALLFMDLDGFKTVNDTYGHTVGDKLLQAVSERIKDTIRITDTTVRLGGDEFTVILTDLRDQDEAVFIAKKIIYELNEEFRINNKAIKIGISIGIAMYPEHGEDMDTLIQHSDDMMYRVKGENKNGVIVYNANND